MNLIKQNPYFVALFLNGGFNNAYMPNRAVASAICNAVKPAIKKQKLNAQIGIDVV